MEVQTRVDVFEDIFLVFLGLGTIVGVVVISYTLYNAYKYRDTGDPGDDEDLPSVGELPTGGKGGKKLFLSFGLSAIIVISLVVWTYGMLLYVEDGPDEPEEAIEIDVEGFAFGWNFYYENGVESDELVVPVDEPVRVQVTSDDVWHSFGINGLRAKADAIPGEQDETWFMAEETGEHTVECFELCGFGHSGMNAPVEVVEQDRYDEWLDEMLTMNITLEDENGDRVTEGFELSLEHQENDQYEEDLSFSYDEADFENGTISITEIEQGGDYDLEITPTDDQFEPVEDSVEFVEPVDETYTLEGLVEETEETDDESDDADDGGDN
ncbi:cytochrome c oxidase subunit II [Halopiger goleimassiliensis]|uniref:cytochrome c oxidase subunit II n=1 Tax=Halopiger goleimassiliensis TaxID=1293048 RepID=UPI000677862F|nr:cytochrome c oxidase subunit II [Halopiger goleimassiliensis]